MNTRLAIALDGSPQAEKVLPIAVKLAKRLPARLLLLLVCNVTNVNSFNNRLKPKKIGNPEIYLEQIRNTLTDPNGVWHISPDQVQIRVRYSESDWDVANIAAEEGAAFLILATPNRPRLHLGEINGHIALNKAKVDLNPE